MFSTNSLCNEVQIFLFFVSNWHFFTLQFVHMAFCLFTVCPNEELGSICSISFYEVTEDSTKSQLIKAGPTQSISAGLMPVHHCFSWRNQDCTQCSRCGLTRDEQRQQSLPLPCWLHLCNALLCSWLPLPQEYTADKQ